MPIVAVSVSDRTPLLERTIGDVVIRPHEHAPSTKPSRRNEYGQYTDHRFLLAMNPAAQRSPAKRGFPNPGLLGNGFENGARFGVQCATA
jgi:hypothetical protein